MRSYSNLPEEIILDILSRLPAKSVGLCRCVSKHWRALLSGPSFVRTHLQRGIILRHESLTFIDSRRCLFSAPLGDAHQVFDKITLTPTKLIFADHPNRWNGVNASCNGLLLVSGSQGKNFVLNPVTKEINEVARSPFCSDPYKIVNMLVALGYDPLNDDYKVLAACYDFDSDDDEEEEEIAPEMFVSVYSLKSGSWKRVESSPSPLSVGDMLDRGVFVDGHIHWSATSSTESKLVIVAFDLAAEKFCEVPPPCSIEGEKIVLFRLTMLGGCLCMFNDSEKYGWIMKEYGVQESWTKFTIDAPKSGEIRRSSLLGQQEGVLLRYGKKLAMYNVKEGTLKDIVVLDISKDPLARVVSFVESLVSPHVWW